VDDRQARRGTRLGVRSLAIAFAIAPIVLGAFGFGAQLVEPAL
jgi:hypothetical protein